MAAFQEGLAGIEQFGVSLVGLSVDKPEITESFQSELGIEFAILSDSNRRVVKGWDRFNRFEMGGIAKPTIFVIDSDMRVRLRADGKADSRYGVDELVEFLASSTRLADLGRDLPHPALVKLGALLGLAEWRTK